MFERIIAYQAKQRPHALAIQTSAGNATYAKFDADIDRVAASLLEIPNLVGRIAVQVKNPSLHWLIILALARLNIASLSLPIGDAGLLSLYHPDLILTDDERTSSQVRSFLVSTKWTEDALSRPLAALPPRIYSPDDAARLVTSSGTTGTPKKILYTRKHVDTRLQNASLAISLGELKMLVNIGLDHSGGYITPLLCWLNGGTVVYPAPNFRWVDVLPLLSPGGIACAPAQLEVLMRSLPANFIPPAAFTCVVAGSTLSQSLSVRARSRLTPNLWVTYASSEAGFTALARASHLEGQEGAVGYVSPWADVEIVDRTGKPCAPGVSGEVRVRSDEIVDGYLDEDDTEERAFRDGWFYPGDLGSLSADGMLTIEGRTNDVMNFGGEKISPLPIEETLTSCPGVRDAVAFAVPGPGGVNLPFAAVVSETGFDREATIARLRARFPLVAINLVETASVPRNAMGKIQREVVRDNVIVKLLEMQAAGTLPQN
jgi:acyl-CoA synthetase (AMP-forming)/AMP-acid ligase II